MSLPEPRTAAGAEALSAILGSPGNTLIGLDFDGTLAPIVDDPAAAAALPGAVEVLDELRRRGYKLGLISVCSEEVPVAWRETPLAERFDATTFSAECGLMKPEPDIYLQTTEALAVEPADCLYVGDGANDELPGAERVGMRAIQLRVPGEYLTPEGERWDGEHVESLSDLIELLDGR